jgi:hypothetical protein
VLFLLGQQRMLPCSGTLPGAGRQATRHRLQVHSVEVSSMPVTLHCGSAAVQPPRAAQLRPASSGPPSSCARVTGVYLFVWFAVCVPL